MASPIKRPGKNYNKTGGNVTRAATGAITGTIPAVGAVKGYKASRMVGQGRGASVGIGVGSALFPPVGAAAGAFRGYHHNMKSEHPNQRNAKTAVRSSTPARQGLGNRVGGK